MDYNALLIPTLKALADRDDLIVIGVLGVKGAKLDGFKIPSNAKVVDYLMYEAVLQYADVFVTNAGYGGFISGVMHGVPMVWAGRGREFIIIFFLGYRLLTIVFHPEDKAEVSMRGEIAGIGVNLETDRPSTEAIRDGVDKVLTDNSFKTRCLEVQRENQKLDCIGQLERIIKELSAET